jgi:hypothetical protein
MKKDNENLKVNKTSWCYVESTCFSSPDLYQKCQMKYCYQFASDVHVCNFQGILVQMTSNKNKVLVLLRMQWSFFCKGSKTVWVEGFFF